MVRRFLSTEEDVDPGGYFCCCGCNGDESNQIYTLIRSVLEDVAWGLSYGLYFSYIPAALSQLQKDLGLSLNATNGIAGTDILNDSANLLGAQGQQVVTGIYAAHVISDIGQLVEKIISTRNKVAERQRLLQREEEERGADVEAIEERISSFEAGGAARDEDMAIEIVRLRKALNKKKVHLKLVQEQNNKLLEMNMSLSEAISRMTRAKSD